MIRQGKRQYTMKTVIQNLGFVAFIALGTTMFGCSTTPVTSTPTGEPQAVDATKPAETPATTQASDTKGEGKISAPVTVTLNTSAKSGTVVVTIKMEALADIPRAVAKIVIPAEALREGAVKVVKGDLVMDFGMVPRGQVRTHEVTLEVSPSARTDIFGGVDCHITSGILLHKGAKPVTFGG